MDLAISFQEIDGAQETWEIICNIQGKDPDEITQEEESDDEFLPDPESGTLPTIHNMLQIMDLGRKAKVIEDILKDNEDYLKKLKVVFEKVNPIDLTL
jgi:protein phosphatase-4 regulatory subunit 3